METAGIVVLPMQEDVGKLQRAAAPEELSELLVIEDIIKIEDCREGCITVKKNGIIINNAQYDVAAGYLPELKNVPGFYNIPILNSNNSDNAEDAVLIAYRSFCDTEEPRHIIWVPGKSEPYLLEVRMDVSVKVQDTQYISTTFSELLAGSEDQENVLRARIESIVHDLARNI